MRFRATMIVICTSILSVFAFTDAKAQKKAPDGVRVLLLSGGQRRHHGYRDQAFYLSNLLEDTGRFEVTINEDAAIYETKAMDKYAMIIAIADRRDPEFKLTESQQKAIVKMVREGKGYISIHGADNAPADWIPEMKEMLGGIFSHVGLPDGKTRKGTYHVKVKDTSHPITAGVSDFTLADELYYNIQTVENLEPLATVEYLGKDWPVAWTRTYGKGRVFHTPLGHRDFGPGKDDPLRNPELARMIVQAADWVSGRAPASNAAQATSKK